MTVADVPIQLGGMYSFWAMSYVHIYIQREYEPLAGVARIQRPPSLVIKRSNLKTNELIRSHDAGLKDILMWRSPL